MELLEPRNARQHGKQPFWAGLQLLVRLTLNTRRISRSRLSPRKRATTRVPALAGLSFVSLTPIVPGRFGNRGFAAIELDLSDQGAAPTVLNRSNLVS